MQTQLKLEEFGMLVLGMLLFAATGYSWWVFPALILLPDLSMAGYLVNNKMGAVFYNLFHHKGLAVLLYLFGVLIRNEVLMLSGIILFSHSSLDRMLGYGLKYPDSFQHTHLGWIGNTNSQLKDEKS